MIFLCTFTLSILTALVLRAAASTRTLDSSITRVVTTTRVIFYYSSTRNFPFPVVIFTSGHRLQSFLFSKYLVDICMLFTALPASCSHFSVQLASGLYIAPPLAAPFFLSNIKYSHLTNRLMHHHVLALACSWIFVYTRLIFSFTEIVVTILVLATRKGYQLGLTLDRYLAPCHTDHHCRPTSHALYTFGWCRLSVLLGRQCRLTMTSLVARPLDAAWCLSRYWFLILYYCHIL